MATATLKTEAGETVSFSEIINVIPLPGGLLMAMTLSEDGKEGYHKIDAVDYHSIRGGL